MDVTAQLLGNIPLMVFLITGTVAVASAVLVVALRNPVHSALFLMLSFLSVAIIFFMLGAEFVGAVQILVYAGGIMVLFLFAVMLINVKGLPGEAVFSKYWKGAVVVGAGLFVVFASIVRTGDYAAEIDNPAAFGRQNVRITEPVKMPDGRIVPRQRDESRSTNAETVGMALYGDYVVPFEVASIFLLVAMIGAIVIGRRELSGGVEDMPEYMLSRAAEEKKVKEAAGA
jgi:NADH-quinone oxidoreductase subunit J